jgi:hypothetical protein
MIKTLGLLLILIILFTVRVNAQKYISGKVVGKLTDSPIQNANISVYNQRDIIFRTISDSSGNFNIPLSLLDKINHVKITAFNFEELLIKDIPRNCSDNLFIGVFKLPPHVIELNEVKIKASKHYRDTTLIDLAGQKFEKNVMIDDVFSTNGFSKNLNGQIYYKGKLVSDMLVNGGDFFGKNNKDVYSLLPAMVLNNIEVIETNIDSTTNTTTLNPTIKINLKFKEPYNKAMFGNESTGLGTEKRYLAGAGLYKYNSKEQVSLTTSSNNINIRDIPLAEPDISFSANSNNVTASNIKLTYNNTIAKKIDVDIAARGISESKKYISESEREDRVISQYANTTNKSNSKLYGITDARLKLTYKIDSLNTIIFTQKNDYTNTASIDSIKYNIQSDSSAILSILSRRQKVQGYTNITELAYKHLFALKKGRGLNIVFNRIYNNNKNNELDNVYNLSNEILKTYYVDGKKKAIINTFNLNADYTEPLSDNSYINIYSNYKSDALKYNSELLSDSLTSFSNALTKIDNQYLQSGLKFQKTFNKVSFSTLVAGQFNDRISVAANKMNHMSFLNLNLDLKGDYQISKNKELSLNYTTVTNYPELNQLINLNNTFDLISQMSGNLNLKPEIKNSFKLSYNSRKENSGGLNIFGNFDYFNSKIALNINTSQNAPQNNFYDNIGNSISATTGFSIYKNASDKFNFNYNASIAYQQQPIIINNKINLNSGVTLTQVISSTKDILKNILSISPLISTTYTKFYYETSTINVLTLTYSDKITFKVEKFKLNIYPLFNYSRSINSLTSFSTNAGVQRNLFSNGVIWIQAYDIFNSFKFNNNIVTATYTQTVKYTNVNRYFILGLSFKFNNIK